MIQRIATAVGLCSLLAASRAWAVDGPTPPHHTFGGQLVFWSGALLIVWFMARQIFKEQFHERKTIRRLVNEIGPFYPELDPQRIEQWVRLCAPHIWNSWNSNQPPALDDYMTTSYRDSLLDEIQTQADGLGQRHCQLLKVLKVHTIGIHMVGPGPAPKDLELMLRVESKVDDVTRDPTGQIVSGSEGPRQVQHFWSLRHDGHRLFLNGLWEAERDMTDLAAKPQPPEVNVWERPENSAGTLTS